jgi:urease accessory protein
MDSIRPEALMQLLRLASPALPVGGFSYSQGLEWAVEAGWIKSEADTADWIAGLLHGPVAQFDAPLLARLYAALAAGDTWQAIELDQRFLVSRESRELREETLQMGYSMTQLLTRLPEWGAAPELALHTWPARYMEAALRLGVPREAALTSYLFTWLESQIAAAIKLVPLGQTAGQRVLSQLIAQMAVVVDSAPDLPEADWVSSFPALAIASSQHETQYCRLFRS